MRLNAKETRRMRMVVRMHRTGFISNQSLLEECIKISPIAQMKWARFVIRMADQRVRKMLGTEDDNDGRLN